MRQMRFPAIGNLALLGFGWVIVRSVLFGPPAWLAPATRISSAVPSPNASAEQWAAAGAPSPVTPRTPDAAAPIKPASQRHDPKSIRFADNTAFRWPQVDGITAENPSLDRAKRRSQSNPSATPVAGENPGGAGPGVRKLSVSAYALIRPGGPMAGIATNGQLGGSQAGVRVQRSLVRSGRFLLSANGRFSAPIEQSIGKEAGFGLAIRRSGRVPAEFLVERRAALDKGARNAVAVLFATGIDDFRLPGKIRVSAYGQAGVVGLKNRDKFVDGAVRAERGLLTLGRADIRLGAVVAGASQPGVSRLDLGPSLSGRFRVAGTSVRVATEWRERIAGNAQPGSGPTVTLGFDY